jgi:hypothetical protein
MFKDPIVDEIRQIRDALASKFDYDINRIVEDARKRQGSDGRRVVSFARVDLSPSPTDDANTDSETCSQSSLPSN